MLRGLRRLNRYERRILNIIKLGGKNARLTQFGFSRKTDDGFRFPIHAIELGTPKAIRNNPVGLVAGVHGLETVGIRILLDFLEYILDKKNNDFLPELKKGKLGLVILPIVNPGGVALKSRSNPAGVDLMRNSGVEAESALPFFGGHKISSSLPYYRGNTMEPESRALFRFVHKYFYSVKDAIMPVLDIHSGFGTIDHVWWPYARTKKPCIDTPLFEKMAYYLKTKMNHDVFKYGPQSETYTTHGDLWDRFYDNYFEHFRTSNTSWSSRFLPITLEVGTWSDLKQDPMKIFRKRGIFNPARENKLETITGYRNFIRDFVLLSQTKLAHWTA
ncbi:M14 family zinc carboxypeptidase [Leptospira sp. GIMC2001]|uniref:M14 family zinc carboxypeptidase n=1 Tax=Leptospira sp. GIMC2001 TaxID=1513297 RepID=UPI00234958C4|nr:M14 family zinc carboxypeptidase [Leptospira sp. GIMC2001]WCL49727.1 M14 family zinc carboxypeptidase [Leptospira sp. GIMC2001]